MQIKFILGPKKFERLAWFWLLFASISNMTCNYDTKWNMGLSCNFLGYYLVGNVIYSKRKKNNKKGVMYIMFGVLLEIVALFIRGIQIQGRIKNAFINEYLFKGWFSPFYLLASIVIFYGVSMLEIEIQFSRIAKYMFYVYLFHAGILSVIQWVTYDKFQLGYNNLIILPLLVIIVFICSVIYNRVYKKIKST